MGPLAVAIAMAAALPMPSIDAAGVARTGRGMVLVMEAAESSGSLALVDVDSGEVRPLDVTATADGTGAPFAWESAADGVVVVTSDGHGFVVRPDGTLIDLGLDAGPQSVTVSDDGRSAVIGRFLVELATGSRIDLAESVHPAFADPDPKPLRLVGGWVSTLTRDGWLFASIEPPHRTFLVGAMPLPGPTVRSSGTVVWGEDRPGGAVVLVGNLHDGGSTLKGRVIFESAGYALPLGLFGDDVVVAEPGGPISVVDTTTGESRDVTTALQIGDFIVGPLVRGGPFVLVEVNVDSNRRTAVALNLETGEQADIAGGDVLAGSREWILWGDRRGEAAMTAMHPTDQLLVDIDIGHNDPNWFVADVGADIALVVSCRSPMLVVDLRAGSATETGRACLGVISPDGDAIAYSTSLPYNSRPLSDNDCADPLILENLNTGQQQQFPDGGCPLAWMQPGPGSSGA